MFKIKSISIILAIFFAGISHAQIEGANLFSTNQVVSIDLDFLKVIFGNNFRIIMKT
jgi:hypothetical protein